MSINIYSQLKNILPGRFIQVVEALTPDEFKLLSLGELGVTSLENVEILVKIEELFNMEFDEKVLLQIGFLRFEEIAAIVEPVVS